MRNILNGLSARILFAADAGASTGEAPTTTPAETSKFAYNEDREFFAASELEKAAARAQEIADNIDGIRVLNYSAEWPEGAGAAILPLARNEQVPVVKDGKPTGEKESKRRLHAIMFWPIFGLDAVQNAPGGMDFLRSIVLADQAASILNPMRRQSWEGDEGFDVTSCPVTLNDHIEGMRGDRGVVAPYLEACKVILPQLKKMSDAFAAITPQYLRTMLQSSAAAKQQMPKLEEKQFFAKLIDKLEAVTKAAGGNVEIYQRWRDTRDQEVAADLDSLDLDNLKLEAPAK